MTKAARRRDATARRARDHADLQQERLDDILERAALFGERRRDRFDTNGAAVEAFADDTRPMYRLVTNLTIQNANLRATRDLLLPKLISGEIDVSDLKIDTDWLVA